MRYPDDFSELRFGTSGRLLSNRRRTGAESRYSPGMTQAGSCSILSRIRWSAGLAVGVTPLKASACAATKSADMRHPLRGVVGFGAERQIRIGCRAKGKLLVVKMHRSAPYQPKMPGQNVDIGIAASYQRCAAFALRSRSRESRHRYHLPPRDPSPGVTRCISRRDQLNEQVRSHSTLPRPAYVWYHCPPDDTGTWHSG